MIAQAHVQNSRLPIDSFIPHLHHKSLKTPPLLAAYNVSSGDGFDVE
jgi:hypothetical protein